MQDNYDFETEMADTLFADDFEVPEAPDSWSLDDFDDLVTDFDEFGL